MSRASSPLVWMVTHDIWCHGVKSYTRPHRSGSSHCSGGIASTSCSISALKFSFTVHLAVAIPINLFLLGTFPFGRNHYFDSPVVADSLPRAPLHPPRLHASHHDFADVI